MKKPLTFTLDHAERACSPGMDNARTLFEPGKSYTLLEMIEKGLPFNDLMWLLTARAKLDAATVPLFQAWAEKCCSMQKVRGQTFDTVPNCVTAVQAAARKWAKGRPTSKGARDWALSVLYDLIKSGDF